MTTFVPISSIGEDAILSPEFYVATGSPRTDFGSKGGASAIKDLERFNAALEKTVKFSDSLKSQSNVFSDLADGSEVDRLTTELKKLEDQSIETAAAGDKLTALGIAIKTKLVDIAVEALQSLVSAIGQTFGDSFEVFGRVMLRFGFETMKIDIMLQILRTKFSDPELKKRLLATKPFELVEGNTWGDRFWGQVNGVGQNWLGKCLMRLRSELENP